MASPVAQALGLPSRQSCRDLFRSSSSIPAYTTTQPQPHPCGGGFLLGPVFRSSVVLEPQIHNHSDAAARALSIGDCPQCPQPLHPLARPTAVVDYCRMSPKTKTRHTTPPHHESQQGRGLERRAAKPPLQHPDPPSKPFRQAGWSRTTCETIPTGSKTVPCGREALTQGMRASAVPIRSREAPDDSRC